MSSTSTSTPTPSPTTTKPTVSLENPYLRSFYNMYFASRTVALLMNVQLLIFLNLVESRDMVIALLVLSNLINLIFTNQHYYFLFSVLLSDMKQFQILLDQIPQKKVIASIVITLVSLVLDFVFVLLPQSRMIISGLKIVMSLFALTKYKDRDVMYHKIASLSATLSKQE